VTVDTRERTGMPIRVDELLRGDCVVFLDAVVEVLDVREVADWPTAMELLIRRSPNGRPYSTLLPRGHLMTGVRLLRRFHLRCVLCERPMPTEADLAQGEPRRALCGPCANPVFEGTVLLPPVRATRMR
jgi:hypothetical protein